MLVVDKFEWPRVSRTWRKSTLFDRLRLSGVTQPVCRSLFEPVGLRQPALRSHREDIPSGCRERRCASAALFVTAPKPQGVLDTSFLGAEKHRQQRTLLAAGAWKECDAAAAPWKRWVCMLAAWQLLWVALKLGRLDGSLMSSPRKPKQGGTAKTSSKGGRATRAAGSPRGLAKRVSSPKATGGRGTAFENRVQATRLLAMCLQTQCTGAPDGYTVAKMYFQARFFGHHTDDLVLDAASPSGELLTVRMQMKASLAATAANKDFKQAVGLAWLDFKSTKFRRGADVSLIISDTSSATKMAAAVEVSHSARASGRAEDWHTRCTGEHLSNERNREALRAIQAAADEYNQGPVPLNELHQFVVHLKFLTHDLDSDDTAEVDNQKTLLSIAGVPRDQVGAVWAQLFQVCVGLNGLGGDVELATVARHIGEPLNAGFQTFRAAQQLRRQPVHLGTAMPGGALRLGMALDMPQVGGALTPSFAESAPATRPSSPNKVVSRQLERIEALRKECRYADAFAQLEVLGQDLDDFDDHQRALWYWLCGVCKWHLRDDVEEAAEDLLRAAALSSDEDKIVASRLQAYLLKKQVEEAVRAGEQALIDFPDSVAVWVAAANARMMTGVRLVAADIPEKFIDKAASWHLVAHSLALMGDIKGAYDSARTALAKPDATFFNRETFLRYGLMLASQDGLGFAYRMLAQDQRELLSAAADAFNDRAQTLWSAQAATVQTAAAANLGFAYLLAGRSDDALALVDEARSHGITSESLYRVEIEALRDAGRPSDALARFESRLAQLPNDALVSYGQLALEGERFDLLNKTINEGMTREGRPEWDRLKETLRLLRWDGLFSQQRADDIRTELAATDITVASTSITDLMFAVRALAMTGGDETLRDKLIDRIAELTLATQDRPDAHLGAKLLLRSGRVEAAAKAYERILPPTAFTELHADLLYCYLRTGRRSEARALLQSMPEVWKKSHPARRMALELAQVACDWALVDELAHIDIALEPRDCTGWMLRILAAVNLEKPDVATIVGEVPEDLDASVQDMARLANAEIRYGHVDKGMRRIYRTRRQHMGDVEAAAFHVSTLTLSDRREQLPFPVPEVVGPGTSVLLEDEEGAQRRVTFDPADARMLPVTEEFVPDGTSLATIFYGLGVGDIADVPQAFDEPKRYRVVALQAASARLFETSNEALRTAVTPSKFMTVFAMPERPDGSMDVEKVQRQLRARSEYGLQALELYKRHPASLGLVAKRLSRDLIDVVRDWPHDGPKLEVATGPFEPARAEAQALLDNEPTWVADLGVLTELAMLGQLDLLGELPRVLVATATYDTITAKLEKESVFRDSVSLAAHDGQLVYRVQTEDEWRKEQHFLQSMADAIKTHCVLVPAYGAPEIGPRLHQIRGVLSVEEFASLLVCLEHKASLLALDERFRKIALLFEVRSAWPQELLIRAEREGRLSRRDYALAIMSMLIRRRTFIGVNPFDLVILMDQAGDLPTAGVNALRDYLCDPIVDFKSAYLATADFLGLLYRRGNCELGVVLELIEYLVEALMRNPSWKPEFSTTLLFLLWRQLNLPEDDEGGRLAVAVFLGKAAERAAAPIRPVVVQALSLYVCSVPWIESGELLEEGFSAKHTGTPSAPLLNTGSLTSTAPDQSSEEPEI
jgi:tetratricopeptide (TPR) repeat protein